tara:strand:- start:8406 stop:8609 length:204 start_codon:yes stop_codon:yes gene_type:complete
MEEETLQNVKFYTAVSLFVLSEGLAFMKKIKPSGLFHLIWCLCKGSECVVKKSIEGVEVVLEYDNQV